MEAVGFSIGLLAGARTCGVRPNRMAEAYPELQLFLKAHIESLKTLDVPFKIL